MSALFQKKNVAESFTWTDGKFESIDFSDERRELRIDFTDYCSNRYRFIFCDVDELVVSDPVYCIHSSHPHEAGKKKLVLKDDDGIVISFRYATVQKQDIAA